MQAKKIAWGVAFIQNGHRFANVPRHVSAKSLHFDYLHKRHDYFVTCCFHAIRHLRTSLCFYSNGEFSIGNISCTLQLDTYHTEHLNEG